MIQSPVITAHMLRDLLTCERRVWLDIYGDPAQRGDPLPDVVYRQIVGVRHEQRVHASTTETLEPVVITSWDEGVTVTRDLMAQGLASIIGAHLEYETPLDGAGRTVTLRGKVDQLRRGPDGRYAPIEIKQRSRPEDADWLQLDVYVWLVSQSHGAAAPAELWLGADALGRPSGRLRHTYDEDRLFDALLRVAALLDDSAAPPVRIKQHCKTCSWLAACQREARQEQSIDLLYRVSRKTRDHMRQAGITTLGQVAAQTPEELQAVKGIGPQTAPMIRANAQAWLEDRPVRYRPLPDDCLRGGWMFDLETWEMGGQPVPWCMGWCDTQGQTQIALVAPVQRPETLTLLDGQTVTLVPDSDGAWQVVADSTPGGDPVFHWTGYDAGILHSTAPQDLRARLGPRMHDLHRTFTRSISLPLNSTSIKPLSAYLGYPWQGYTDWWAAYQDYRQWLDQDDLGALTRACMYQRADVQSMAWVWRWLVTEESDRE